ncbi:MAG: glycoside hydrolase family 75 protein [Dermatophilaceae bacterium]
MDIDCDGKPSTVCNKSADPAFQPQTSATDSKGAFLDASELPYVVIPLPSTRFDYAKAGLELGTVVAVIYDGKVEYGVFGDEGPDNIIGEASYAMAQLLGIRSRSRDRRNGHGRHVHRVHRQGVGRRQDRGPHRSHHARPAARCPARLAELSARDHGVSPCTIRPAPCARAPSRNAPRVTLALQCSQLPGHGDRERGAAARARRVGPRGAAGRACRG